MLGQPRPQQDDENLTVNRSSRLHQVTAATAARAQRPLPERRLFAIVEVAQVA
jgi:hypothetical protein